LWNGFKSVYSNYTYIFRLTVVFISMCPILNRHFTILS